MVFVTDNYYMQQSYFITSRKIIRNEKCSRNGTANNKKTRYRKVQNVLTLPYLINGFYLTTQHQGECGHTEGHTYGTPEGVEVVGYMR